MFHPQQFCLQLYGCLKFQGLVGTRLASCSMAELVTEHAEIVARLRRIATGLETAAHTSEGSSGTALPATQRLLPLKPKRLARPSHAPSSSFAEVSAARSQARGAERIRDNRFPTRGPESISRSPRQRRRMHQAWDPGQRWQLKEEAAQTPPWRSLARPTRAPSSKLQSIVVECTRDNLRPTRREGEEGAAARHDGAAATPYPSWHRRREHTECICESDLEGWLADNQPLFEKVDVEVNLDLVMDVFNGKKEPLPPEERMLQGGDFSNLRNCPKYSPHAGDRIGLFLRLLHHNLPMLVVSARSNSDVVDGQRRRTCGRRRW